MNLMKSKMQEVIFFFGPPFSGKTSYYEQHLKSSHERVSASEFYHSNPSWGLRHFILHLLKILGEGKGVVIDDENWSRKTRQSCIQSIRVKLPACKFICHVFQPKDAFECLWRREWILAQYFSSQEENKPSHQQPCPTVDLSATEARIHMWFRHESGDHVSGLDAVEESEGWHQIEQIKTSLQPKANYKFEVPAAFLDWQGLMEQTTDDLVEAILIWKHSTLCGRVIVLASITDEVSNVKDSQDSNPGDVYKSVLKKLQAKTQALARQLNIPVYYVIIKDQKQSGSFTRSPKPGILSFLQRLHHIDLQHPGTVYIYQSKSSRATEFAQTGIKQFTAGLVCKNPNTLAQCQGARISGSAHESITDFDYIVENNKSIPSAIPFNKIISDDNEADVDGTCVAEERWGRVLGVSYKDKPTFRRFQEEYTTNASHISAEGSKIGHRPLQSGAKRGSSTIPVKTIEPQSHQEGTISRNSDGDRESTRIMKLPSWMTPKRSKNEGETKDGVTTANKKYAGLPSTIYCMTVAELREVAQIFLNQNEDSDASSGSFPDSTKLNDSSSIMNSAQEEESLDQSYEDMKLEMEESDSEGETSAKETRCKTSLPGDEERNVRREDGDDRDRRKERPESGDDGGDDGVASIITDLFAGESRRKRPPPKKKTARSPFAPSSNVLWSDEELSCQMNTTCTTSRGNHPSEEKPKESKPAIQDFSFLDEIF